MSFQCLASAVKIGVRQTSGDLSTVRRTTLWGCGTVAEIEPQVSMACQLVGRFQHESPQAHLYSGSFCEVLLASQLLYSSLPSALSTLGPLDHP